jgi:transposase
MASAGMPEEFFETVSPHLPPEQPIGPKGGRPRVGHHTVIRVIWFVLTTGARWEDVPAELGCSGRTAHRRLRAWKEAGIWDRLHADLLRLLKKAGKLDTDTVIIDAVTVRAFGGGEQTGPSPVDRRKKGTKHTLMVSRTGVPLAIRTAGANASDHRQIIPYSARLSQGRGCAGSSQGVARRGVRRPGLRQRVDEGVAAVAGDRAAHCQAEDSSRERPGESPLGGGADDQLAQGTAADAGALRSAARDRGRMDDTGSQCHLLPHPAP